MNFIYLLEGAEILCDKSAVQDIAYLIGIVMLALKIAVPIILIIVGMTEMIQAITSQDENQIKKAGTKLVKKAVAAIAVFLITLIVGLLMGLIGGKDYEACMDCVNGPFSSKCGAQLKGNANND